MKTAAIVVTFNRKQLLIRCLTAIQNQTKSVDAIYIIDNCSTDGTEWFLKENGYIKESPPNIATATWRTEKEVLSINNSSIHIYYVRMNENVGGAGGFYEGIKSAYRDGYYWLWLMDDDTMPNEQALEKLINKMGELSDINPGFACSKVLWKDGTIHKMNIPKISPIVNEIPFNYYEEKGILLAESASFVSLLTNREVVKK